MKLAILGTDGDILLLVISALAEGHEIVWVGDVRPTDVEALSLIVPGYVDRADEWELLLDRANADAVMVGRGKATSELKAEQLKRLATEAVPMLVVQPIVASVLPYYEVDMARRESGGVARHYNPTAGHPILAEMSQWIAAGHPTIGTIQQISCQRRVADVSRVNVLAQLARDVEVVASIAGDVRRVSAIGPAINDANFGALQIQMTAAGRESVSWSVRSVNVGESHLELTLVGQRGALTLRTADEASDERTTGWIVEVQGDQKSDSRTLAQFDAPRIALMRLADAVSTQPGSAHELSTWDTATRAMEVVDAVEISLQKGRTIEVFQQQLTERLAFRGTMAALGCGLLLVAFVVVVLVTFLGGAEAVVGRRILPWWPLMMLAVLAFFLLLQAVPFLARGPHQDRPK
jgi:hypothetical protein